MFICNNREGILILSIVFEIKIKESENIIFKRVVFDWGYGFLLVDENEWIKSWSKCMVGNILVLFNKINVVMLSIFEVLMFFFFNKKFLIMLVVVYFFVNCL